MMGKTKKGQTPLCPSPYPIIARQKPRIKLTQPHLGFSPAILFTKHFFSKEQQVKGAKLVQNRPKNKTLRHKLPHLGTMATRRLKKSPILAKKKKPKGNLT